MQHFSISPLALVRSLRQNRGLIGALVRREIVGRYRGSVLGLVWSFVNPVLLLAVYTFVFSEVFKARWSGGVGSKTEFAIVLFSGLVIFNLFAECFNRAPALVLSNVNYVKKVVFPLEILPVVALGAALFHLLVSALVWFLFFVLFMGMPPMTALLLPVAIIPLLMLSLGVGWFMASLGVYLRDIAQFTGIVTTVLMFMSPIFYPVTMLPKDYQYVMLLNPLTPVIEQAREVMIWGRMPDWTLLGGYTAAMLVMAWLGFAWFQKTRKGFADVL
ncbi:MAG: ABC transporter permease [Burkholderia gladioli]